MKTTNVQLKGKKLKLNKISIVNLTSVEMMDVNGGDSVIIQGPSAGANTGTGGGGTNTLTTTRTVQSVAPSGPCTGEPGPFILTTISSFSKG